MAFFRASFFLIAGLVALGSAGAQQAPSIPAASAKESGQAAKSASTPAIAVTAPCANNSPETKAPKMCVVVVSGEDFAKLADVVIPDAAAPARSNFGKNYGQMLGFAAEARARGLDKTPAYEQMLEFAKLNALSALLVRQVRKQADTISDADLEAYYRDHQADYEQLKLLRVMIPRQAAKTQPADAGGQQAYAAKIRARWIAGEDPEKLQQEAFQRADNKAQPPAIHMEARKASIAPAQQSIFALKEGEFSAPLADPAYVYLYKVVKKEAVPMADVKGEIQRTLAAQRFQEEGQKLKSEIDVKLDPDYFRSEPGTATPGAPGVPPGRGTGGPR